MSSTNTTTITKFLRGKDCSLILVLKHWHISSRESINKFKNFVGKYCCFCWEEGNLHLSILVSIVNKNRRLSTEILMNLSRGKYKFLYNTLNYSTLYLKLHLNPWPIKVNKLNNPSPKVFAPMHISESPSSDKESWKS